MDHECAPFGGSVQPQYDLDMYSTENDFDMEFGETVDLDNALASPAPADLKLGPDSHVAGTNPVSSNFPRWQTQTPSQHPQRRVRPVIALASATHPSGPKTSPKARQLLNQFGQAAHRLRAISERIAAVEKLSTQVVELSRRLSMVEQRLSEVQGGLKTAEEGHEEISQMVKASLSFLNDVNSDPNTAG